MFDEDVSHDLEFHPIHCASAFGRSRGGPMSPAAKKTRVRFSFMVWSDISRRDMSSSYVIDERVSGPSALWLESERYEVGSIGDVRIGDLVNDAHNQRLLGVYGGSLTKELLNATRLDGCPVDNDVAHSGLIS